MIFPGEDLYIEVVGEDTMQGADFVLRFFAKKYKFSRVETMGLGRCINKSVSVRRGL